MCAICLVFIGWGVVESQIKVENLSLGNEILYCVVYFSVYFSCFCNLTILFESI